jgi:hypothetical protein
VLLPPPRPATCCPDWPDCGQLRSGGHGLDRSSPDGQSPGQSRSKRPHLP